MERLAAVSLLALVLCATACGDEQPTMSGDAPSAATSPPDAIASTGERPRVELDDGALEGTWVTGGVRAFLGIPFARPPIGPLRWQPPQPNEPWTGVRDASRFGDRCPQPPSSDPLNVATEDCLYLNVWAPQTATKLPVMIWIHGGGNVNGSSSELAYDGQYLAGQHGIVLVSVNYRLGVFGFFGAAELAAEGERSGNQGMWDQQLAMQWVQQNIEQFGGDPNTVTIFGESAGSTDVCLHVAAPQSRGLFHRAISESGGCTTFRSGAATAQRTAARFATQLGCSSDVLSCLRQKSVTELIDGASAFGGGFGPFVDGAFLPEQPRALFDRGDIAKVPYILGSNTDEGSYWALDATGITSDEQYLQELGKRFTPPIEPIAELYPRSRFADAKDPYQAAISRAWGDARLVCGTFDVGVRAAAAGMPVHMYNFDIPVDDVIGAAHAAEIVFVFGTLANFNPNWSSEALAVSQHMRAYWTNFAKTGDPNGGELSQWPALTDQENVRMNFALSSSLVTDFRKPECEFWRSRFDAAFTAQ
jgi:para-nitrobenzyl esterase